MKIKMLKKLISIMCSAVMAASCTVTSVGAVPTKHCKENFEKQQRETEKENDVKKQWNQTLKEYDSKHKEFVKWKIRNKLTDNDDTTRNNRVRTNNLSSCLRKNFDINKAEEFIKLAKETITIMDKFKQEYGQKIAEKESREKEQLRLKYNEELEKFRSYAKWNSEERSREMKYVGFHSFAKDKQWQEHVKLLEANFKSQGFDLKVLAEEFDNNFNKSKELLAKIKEVLDGKELDAKDAQSMVDEVNICMGSMEKTKNEYSRRAYIQDGLIGTRLNSDFLLKVEEFNKQKEEYNKWHIQCNISDDLYLAYYSINQAKNQLDVVNSIAKHDNENSLKAKGKFIDLANEAINEMKKNMKEWNEQEKTKRETRIKSLMKKISELIGQNAKLSKEKDAIVKNYQEQVNAINKEIEAMENELATFELLFGEGNQDVTQEQIRDLKVKVESRKERVSNLQKKEKEEVANIDKQIKYNKGEKEKFQNEAKTLRYKK